MRYKIILIVFSIFLYSCDNCKECDNKLEDILGNYPDKMGSVVEFGINDSIINLDTVIIKYYPPEKYYDCPLNKEGTMSCAGSIDILIDKFSLKILQGVNINGNESIRLSNLRCQTGDQPKVVKTLMEFNF